MRLSRAIICSILSHCLISFPWSLIHGAPSIAESWAIWGNADRLDRSANFKDPGNFGSSEKAAYIRRPGHRRRSGLCSITFNNLEYICYAMEVLPNVEKVQTLSTEGRAALLDRLFEPSTPLHTLCVDVLHENVYTSYYELIGAVEKQFNDLLSSSSVSDTKWLDSILSSHPRLGEKKIDSKQSAAEQAQLQSEEDDDDSLPTLNGQYESQFPGLRFV